MMIPPADLRVTSCNENRGRVDHSLSRHDVSARRPRTVFRLHSPEDDMSLSSRSRVLALAFVALCAACAGPTDSSEPAPILPPTVSDSSVVPAQGTASTLDIGNWNLEWFGDPTEAPDNDSLQIANVKSVIAGADVDIWGLVEVVNTAAWDTLRAIPGYSGVLANDASIPGGTTYYSTSEQKPACLFKTSIATLTSAELILTADQADFAGRPPLECKLHVTLGGQTEDLVVIVMHMKAFDDLSSYGERLAASADLKAYLDATYPTQKVAGNRRLERRHRPVDHGGQSVALRELRG